MIAVHLLLSSGSQKQQHFPPVRCAPGPILVRLPLELVIGGDMSVISRD